jgi:hypothetical protein
MKRSMTLPVSLTVFLTLLIPSILFSQNCIIGKDSLQGTYTGDCKKGKADGKGKAVGTDTYEGEFRSGLPEGKGTYTWKNGNKYTGNFKKGLREGRGTMQYKRQYIQDSVVDGFWKRDAYIGEHEKPYQVFFKGKTLTDVSVDYTKDVFNQAKFLITSTTTGAPDANWNPVAAVVINDVQLIQGSYSRIAQNDNHLKKSETIFYDVGYPIHMRVKLDKEDFEIALYEPGSYVINISLNK